MWHQSNPLDLNNSPEEYGDRRREGKQVLEESSIMAAAAAMTKNTSYCSKKERGEKEECGKVYECRFCSLKFCKSQALGGHMNRHRQERETETLNRARELVFSSQSLAGPGSHPGTNRYQEPNMGITQSIAPGYFDGRSCMIRDPSPPFRVIYQGPPSTSPSSILSPQQPPPLPPYLYPAATSRHLSFLSPYPPHVNDYFIDRFLTKPNHHYATAESNYTSTGSPITTKVQGHPRTLSRGNEARSNPMDRMNWSYIDGNN